MAVESRKRKVLSFAACIFVFAWINLVLNSIDYSSSFNSLSLLYESAQNYFNSSINGSGVILFVKGGLGNQLFEFACSYALAREKNWTLYNFIIRDSSDTGLFASVRSFQSSKRQFVLDKFQISLDNFIDKTTVINSSSVVYLNDSNLLYKNYPRRSSFLQLTGNAYCQSEEYWGSYKHDILSMFALKPEVVRRFPESVHSVSKEIEEAEQSVAIHVRRGDFTKVNGFEMPISYQKSAIHNMIHILGKRSKTQPTFFVFSDDGEYTRKGLESVQKSYGDAYKFVYVSYQGNFTSLEDFYLMTKCKHFIIPNSTFSWWAAYLSQHSSSRKNYDSIVIASAFNPKFWKLWKGEERKFYKMLHGQKYHPRNWIIINPFVGQ